MVDPSWSRRRFLVSAAGTAGIALAAPTLAACGLQNASSTDASTAKFCRYSGIICRRNSTAITHAESVPNATPLAIVRTKTPMVCPSCRETIAS